MPPTILLLAKVLLASLIVGFVTASIQSWVDRFFLVILLTGLVGLPIQRSITINLAVVSLAALMMTLRQSAVLTSIEENLPLLIVPAILGGMLGRLAGLHMPASILMLILGVYAILAGLRMVLIKPLPEDNNHPHPAWLAVIAMGFGGITGLLSAGGKPFTIPIYNRIMGYHPRRAYAMASIGVVAATLSALGSQALIGASIEPADLALAVYAFTLIHLIATGVRRFWTPQLNQIVTWIISPLLVLVGIRFVWMSIL